MNRALLSPFVLSVFSYWMVLAVLYRHTLRLERPRRLLTHSLRPGGGLAPLRGTPSGRKWKADNLMST